MMILWILVFTVGMLSIAHAETFFAGDDITVSGISAGGFAAALLHVAYSGRVRGSAVFAGGVYYCSRGDIVTAVTSCLTGDNIDLDKILQQAEEFAKKGLIDELKFLRSRPTIVWTGRNDSVVLQKSSEKWVEFLEHYQADVKAVWDTECGHAFPTEDPENTKDEKITPFINNWEYNGAYEALNHLYNGNIIDSDVAAKYQNLFKYNQDLYSSIPGCMHHHGFVYIPTRWQDKDKRWPVHIALHGCLQTVDHIGLKFIWNTHYSDLAERNDLIVMYPQGIQSTNDIINPRGCFDWWGYCDSVSKENFGTQNASQIKSIMDAVYDLQNGKLNLTRASKEVFTLVKCENRGFYNSTMSYPVFSSDPLI